MTRARTEIISSYRHFTLVLNMEGVLSLLALFMGCIRYRSYGLALEIVISKFNNNNLKYNLEIKSFQNLLHLWIAKKPLCPKSQNQYNSG